MFESQAGRGRTAESGDAVCGGCPKRGGLCGSHRAVAELNTIHVNGVHFVIVFAIAIHSNSRRNRVTLVKATTVSVSHGAEFYSVEIIRDNPRKVRHIHGNYETLPRTALDPCLTVSSVLATDTDAARVVSA